jgi:hypothetical protein
LPMLSMLTLAYSLAYPTGTMRRLRGYERFSESCSEMTEGPHKFRQESLRVVSASV